MVFYFILIDSSSMNQMQPEVNPCKVEIGKGKNESESGRNRELEREMCLQ